MSVYLAVPLANNIESLKSAISTKIDAGDYHALQSSAGFLIKYDGTTIELCKLLDISWSNEESPPERPTGSALVVPISNYYGRGSADMWEWLGKKFIS